MANELRKSLKRMLTEILRELSDFNGMPMALLIRVARNRAAEMSFSVTNEDIESALRDLIDSWEVDKVVSYLLEEEEKELGLPLGLPAWHIKLLTSEERSVYEALAEESRAVIRLLQSQTHPENLGQISFKEGSRLLAEQGFSLDIGPPEIEGKVRSYMVLSDTGWEWWFGLISEGEKYPPVEDSDAQD